MYADFCLFYIRKVAEGDDNDSEEETKKSKMVMQVVFNYSTP